MPRFSMMSYNIEHMNKMFENNAVKPSKTERAGSIAQVIQDTNPHVLGLCEAANAEAEHTHFIESEAEEFRLPQALVLGRRRIDVDSRNVVHYSVWSFNKKIGGN